MDPDRLSPADEAFLDEVFELAFRHRSTGEPVDVEALLSGRGHLRERVLRALDLAGELAFASPPPEPGRRFAHYRILRQLGRGGQATVYLAEDLRLARQVALKILDPAAVGSKQSVERFRREAAITSRLDHPGICTVYDAGESSDSFWIAMRYIDGTSLAHKIAAAKSRAPKVAVPAENSGAESDGLLRVVRGRTGRSSDSATPAELSQLLAIFEKAARALHVAHEHGVIHRDIKPGNIMVNCDDEPVLLDFGLAHEIESGTASLTLTGALIGTPAYMSPEQLASDGTRLDRRTDIYSLGASLYECITLNRPFDMPTRQGLYQAILTREIPDVRDSNASVGRDLKVVLETAMEKDRDRRYQTALAFADDLRRVRVHEPIVARPVGPLGRFSRWTRRNPKLALAVAGLFVVLAIGLVTSLLLLAERNAALGDKGSALAEKTATLSDYERLGDLSRLQRLQAEADMLWPSEPSKVPAMKAWLTQGLELVERLPGHREVLNRLRTSTGLLQYSTADREADLTGHAPTGEELRKLRQQRAEVLAALSEPSRVPTHSLPRPEELRAALVKLDAEIARLESGVTERLTWRFASSADQFRHDTTQELVADLTAFANPDPRKGLLADVRARLEFVGVAEQATMVRHEARWAEAVRSIGDRNECPEYGGLRIQPQFGLVPVGRDPASRLWEFAHFQTTAPGTDPIPARGPDGRLILTAGSGVVLVLLPGGTFKMGAVRADEGHHATDSNVDPDSGPAERPLGEVTLDPFFMSKYEMTQGQWLRMVGKNPSRYVPGEIVGATVTDRRVDLRNPVEEVRRDECELWMGRLGLVLPTEAQWEYAARGGTTTPRWTGIGIDALATAENLADAFLRKTRGATIRVHEPWDDGYAVHAPAGSFAPNPFGLHDVLGNVSEWVRDWCGSYDVTPRAGDGLRNPLFSRARLARGASFSDVASAARSAYRWHSPPDASSATIGVRPAMPCRRD